MEHCIDLVPDAKLFKSPLYRSSPKQDTLNSLRLISNSKQTIEPAVSEWAAPALFAPKNDGRLCFCIDYHKLNALTIKDTHPLPRIDEGIDLLGEA